ncbi:helix-turn-helix transcriptional regulator [Mesorhizobium sp. CCANP35]|uniref:Helix-turn-helix transcriptional regulator n=1 Tax=Mesorhizobium neociceri TaxID=1307853 RepID=A0A838B2J8_9HYPH|nr:helix-turn-helix transcriptional regulator [Mesorhizobium neociceri]
MPQRPYGLLCPISRACEVLEPRWTIQILTELWAGSTRFNDIRRGVGYISSGLLSKRLKELEAAGLIERLEDRAAGTVDYVRTEKAILLEPALNALAEWAQCNIDADLALRDTNVSTLMWNVRRRKINMLELPNRRTVIRFHFNDDPPPDYPTYWLVAQPGSPEPELCTTDPGVDVDLFVETCVVSLGGILTGRASIDREIQQGALFLSGNAGLARTMHRWLRGSSYAAIAGIATLYQGSVLPNRSQ